MEVGYIIAEGDLLKLFRIVSLLASIENRIEVNSW